jgi:hypothetical protein
MNIASWDYRLRSELDHRRAGSPMAPPTGCRGDLCMRAVTVRSAASVTSVSKLDFNTHYDVLRDAADDLPLRQAPSENQP